VEIKIGNSAEYLKLTEFSPELHGTGYTGDIDAQDYFYATLELTVNEISASVRAYVALGELIQLHADLIKLYGELKHSFVFANLEDNVNMSFTPTITGHIDIKRYVRNSDYTASIDFKITTDQSYLPDTIGQLREVLTAMKVS